LTYQKVRMIFILGRSISSHINSEIIMSKRNMAKDVIIRSTCRKFLHHRRVENFP
jgi:hypothetical protein